MSVHSAHCCVIHGCKYGDENCPVVLGDEVQESPCSQCFENADEAETAGVTGVVLRRGIACENISELPSVAPDGYEYAFHGEIYLRCK